MITFNAYLVYIFGKKGQKCMLYLEGYKSLIKPNLVFIRAINAFYASATWRVTKKFINKVVYIGPRYICFGMCEGIKCIIQG